MTEQTYNVYQTIGKILNGKTFYPAELNDLAAVLNFLGTECARYEQENQEANDQCVGTEDNSPGNPA